MEPTTLGTGICLSTPPLIAWFYPSTYAWTASVGQQSRDTRGLAWGLKLAYFSPTLGTQPLPPMWDLLGPMAQGQSKPWSLEGHAPKMLACCPWPSLSMLRLLSIQRWSSVKVWATGSHEAALLKPLPIASKELDGSSELSPSPTLSTKTGRVTTSVRLNFRLPATKNAVLSHPDYLL